MRSTANSNHWRLQAQPPTGRNWIFWLRLVLLVGLVFMAVLLGWVVIQFSLPKPIRISAGSVHSYQEGISPRLFWAEGTPFYVLQADGELIALSAYSRRWIPCLIRWDAEQGQFVDPCWGTRMFPNGAYEGGGPPWEMDHLPVLLLEGEVWVDIGYR
jgi:hypothetical protein